MTYDQIIEKLYPDSPPVPNSMPLTPFEAIQHGFQRHLKIRARRDADELSSRFHSAVEDLDPMSPDYSRQVRNVHRDVSGQSPGFFNNPYARSIFKTELEPGAFADERIAEQAPNLFGNAVDSMFDQLTQLDPSSPFYKVNAAKIMADVVPTQSAEAQKMFLRVAPTMLGEALDGWATIRARGQLDQWRERSRAIPKDAPDAREQRARLASELRPTDIEAAQMFDQGVTKEMEALGHTEEQETLQWIVNDLLPWERKFEEENRELLMSNPWRYMVEFDRQLREKEATATQMGREYIQVRKPAMEQAQKAIIKEVHGTHRIELDQDHAVKAKIKSPSDVKKEVEEAAPQTGEPNAEKGWNIPAVSPTGSTSADEFVEQFGVRSWPQDTHFGRIGARQRPADPDFGQFGARSGQPDIDWSQESALSAAVSGAGGPVPTEPGGVARMAPNNLAELKAYYDRHGTAEGFNRPVAPKDWRQYGSSYLVASPQQKTQMLGLTPPSGGFNDTYLQMVQEAGPAVKQWQDMTTAPVPPLLMNNPIFREMLKAASYWEMSGGEQARQVQPVMPSVELFDPGLDQSAAMAMLIQGRAMTQGQNAFDQMDPYGLGLGGSNKAQVDAAGDYLGSYFRQRGMERDAHYKNQDLRLDAAEQFTDQQKAAAEAEVARLFGDPESLEKSITKWMSDNKGPLRVMRVRSSFTHMIGRALSDARGELLTGPNVGSDGEYTDSYKKFMRNIAIPMAFLEKEGAGLGGGQKHIIDMLNSSSSLDIFTAKLQDWYSKFTGEDLIAKIEQDFGYNKLRETTDRWSMMNSASPVALGVVHPTIQPFTRMEAAGVMQDIYGTRPFTINEQHMLAGANQFFLERKVKQETGGSLGELERALGE